MSINYGYSTFNSPLGELILTSSGSALTGIYLPKQAQKNQTNLNNFDQKLYQNVCKQLNEYFSGKRQTFDVPINLVGTEFQIKVWTALLNIEFGETKTYGEIAKILNNEQASRAVGMAIGKNPISIIVPCHRVIGANRKLTGYAGGLDAKKMLLELEGVQP